jgi:hypothetical protein
MFSDSFGRYGLRLGLATDTCHAVVRCCTFTMVGDLFEVGSYDQMDEGLDCSLTGILRERRELNLSPKTPRCIFIVI